MSPHRLCALIAAFLIVNSALSRGAENIGSAKQLFIDDHIIASLGNAERVFKQPVRLGPLLSASPAWETKRSLAYPTVRREGPNAWKMWYRAASPAGERTICYATSEDGITWTKPALGIYPHNGGQNNIVLIGSETFVDTPSVFREDDEFYLYCTEGDVRYVIYHSPDGIHDWKKASRGLHVNHDRVVKSGTHAPASHNYDICLGVYDPYQQDYILHFKIAQKQKLFGPNDWQRTFFQHRYSGSLARTHLHAIVFHERFRADPLAAALTDFRKFTGRNLSDFCQPSMPDCFTQTLRDRSTADRERRFWQPSRHPVALLTEKFWQQKLNYLHENPVRKGLVRQARDWRFTSAAWYDSDAQFAVDVQLTGIDWS